MTDLELLECAQSVYEFLIDDEDINLNKSFNSFMEFHTFKKMNETLTRYGCCKENGVVDMVGFTTMLNNRFKLYDIDIFEERMINDPKSFFSTTISHNFYRTILRELKLNLCLS
jgi:hypothetical protein